MRSPRSVLEDTDWGSLEHAYDSASDTPDQLMLLLSGDAALCGEALAYLDGAVLHQGTIYSATAPAALFVAGILDDPRTLVPCESALPWDERERPLRAALLEWLGNVAESATYDDPEPDDDETDDWEDYAQAVEACRAIRPDLYARVAPFLDHTEPTVRQAAVGAVTDLLLAPELAEQRAEVADRLLRSVEGMTPVERAGIALTIGSWGIAPRSLLADEHPGVRACAALTKALDDDPRARDEVRLALRDPRTADSWFDENPPQLDGQVRFTLVEALLRRTTAFDEVAEAALAVARMTNAYTVDSDWGPLLIRAFPEGFVKGQELSAAQRQFLTAIVDNDRCWGSIANPTFWFSRAGLPADRDGLRALLTGSAAKSTRQ
ncbi:hypothetical protein [Micromonospora sp. NPDC051296]|uniref:hypothetical protein n=1 Tax=Micromonospora sp. NPDC051296 TaxID=3155046 RepID=UPI003412B4D0